jgi:hypothetical protein
MTTQKQFINGGPVPVTPKSIKEKVQDLTPGQTISSEDQDYDENEHSDDSAYIMKETRHDDEAMEEFVIDFIYEKMPFTGLVLPRKEGDDLLYSVKLESQNQELNLDITANPCGDGKIEWCFKGEPGESGNYDPALLLEIGEAIEKYQANSL